MLSSLCSLVPSPSPCYTCVLHPPLLLFFYLLLFRAVTYCCRCQTAPHLRQVHGDGRASHACLTSVHVVGSQSHADSPRSSRFSTIVIGTIVIIFTKARRPSPWPEALRCDSGQCDRLVERRLRISDCPLSQNGCCGGALNYHLTFFIFGNTSSDPTKHTPCPGPRPLTYAALDT